MYRLAYRRFGDGHESLVGNYTVKSNNVAAVRWFELRRVTAGPVRVFQENTYQPDATWRWMGSAAMDGFGNLVIGFSASSPTIHPQIRYAGRLATDPLTLWLRVKPISLTARVANSTPVTVGAITAQWPLIQWTTSPSGTRPNTIIQTAVSTGARGSAVFTSSNSPKYHHFGVRNLGL